MNKHITVNSHIYYKRTILIYATTNYQKLILSCTHIMHTYIGLHNKKYFIHSITTKKYTYECSRGIDKVKKPSKINGVRNHIRNSKWKK